MWTEINFFDSSFPAPGIVPAAFAGGKTGAWTEFTGKVRAWEKDAKISALRYEIYRPLARKVLAKHTEELAQKYSLLAVRFWHREGLVPVGEAAVYVAVASAHRKEAFAALAELLDRLKTNVPIWKMETGANEPDSPEPENKLFAPDSVGAVWQILNDRVTLLGNERVPLQQALKRTLQAEVLADADQPPFDRSAMDGYAFIPTTGPAKYKVVGTVKAGEIAARAPGAGEALRIFTGAEVPA
ncbi:MAG TPA: molybdenum cofactor biosynthesis protein MoaE, partial [Opitutales bacterium]|nr:molybdenum cofactor biosynthesis protein MoaE [Opitutales bacterium]